MDFRKTFCGSAFVFLLATGPASGPAVGQSLAEGECTNTAGVDTNLTPSTPSADFQVVGDAGDGIVRHTKTGLEWRRCPLGRTFDAGACVGASSVTDWQGALEAASQLGDGWRVPNVNELASIVEECASGPAINQVVFPGTIADQYWTSTQDAEFGAEFGLLVNFSTGSDSGGAKIDNSPVMVVRDSTAESP